MCCAYVEYKVIDHIGKDEYFARVVFFCILFSISMRALIMKEGDRMEHKDDVLTDSAVL